MRPCAFVLISLFFSQKERLKYQKDYMESIKKLEEQLVMNQRKNDNTYMLSSREVVVFSFLLLLIESS